jgi:hypothetical protein
VYVRRAKEEGRKQARAHAGAEPALPRAVVVQCPPGKFKASRSTEDCQTCGTGFTVLNFVECKGWHQRPHAAWAMVSRRKLAAFSRPCGVVVLLCWFFETDLNPPVVTILGRNPLVVEQFASFVYAVASATDAADGTVAAERRNSINTSMCRAAPCGGLAALARAEGWPHANADEIGAFVVNYTATDRAG